MTTLQQDAGREPAATGAEALDPITYEVIRHRLWSINDEACTTLVHASGSPVVHASDFNFSIYMPDGEMAVVGMLYMIPVGTMALVVKLIRERFGDDLREGDVFFCNDPYLAAAHQNDVQLVAPFFHDGRLTGWTGCAAHELDVGGMEAGSWCPKATDVYQEGIRIPPVRLRREGVLQREIWELIVGASRLPFMLAMDLTAILAAHKVAHSRLAEICERYGAGQVIEAMAMSLRQSAATVRAALAELPDGECRHTDFIDHDGHTNEIYEITCLARKSGETLTLDFTDSAPQAPGFINSTAAATLGAVISAVFPLLGAQAPSWNAGVMEPVELVLPKASIVNPVAPAPVSASSVAASWVASHCAIGAISKLISTHPSLADEATAISDGTWPLFNLGGLNQYGEPFGDMFLDPVAWGGGAYRHRDGIDGGGAFIAPRGVILDVETKENAVPVLYLWRRERLDSGGPGRHRGGVTTEFAVTPYGVDSFFTTLATHGVAQPNCSGLFGGYPGAGAGYELATGTDLFERFARSLSTARVSDLAGTLVELEAKTSMFELRCGDVLNVIPEGGGGYDDPCMREPAAVAADVRDRRVSAAAAGGVYGVVLTEHGEADVEATVRRRQEMLTARLAEARPPSRVDGASPARSSQAAFTLGSALALLRDGGALWVTCAGCGHGLGSAGENWKEHAASLDLGCDKLGTPTTLDARMAITAYLCPSCGTALDVAVGRRDAAPYQDLKFN